MPADSQIRICVIHKTSQESRVGMKLHGAWAKVELIAEGGLAAVAGIEIGDIIVAVNGFQIKGYEHGADIIRDVVGDVEIHVRRVVTEESSGLLHSENRGMLNMISEETLRDKKFFLSETFIRLVGHQGKRPSRLIPSRPVMSHPVPSRPVAYRPISSYPSHLVIPPSRSIQSHPVPPHTSHLLLFPSYSVKGIGRSGFLPGEEDAPPTMRPTYRPAAKMRLIALYGMGGFALSLRDWFGKSPVWLEATVPLEPCDLAHSLPPLRSTWCCGR